MRALDARPHTASTRIESPTSPTQSFPRYLIIEVILLMPKNIGDGAAVSLLPRGYAIVGDVGEYVSSLARAVVSNRCHMPTRHGDVYECWRVRSRTAELGHIVATSPPAKPPTNSCFFPQSFPRSKHAPATKRKQNEPEERTRKYREKMTACATCCSSRARFDAIR